MDAPRRLEQMINACGDIHVDTRVQVCENKRLNGQIILLDLLIRLPLLVGLVEDSPEAFAKFLVLFVVLIFG